MSESDLLKKSLQLIESGDFAAAAAILKPAVEADGASTEALVTYGAALRMAGDTDEALKIFDQTLLVDAICWPALINAASIRLERGNAAWVVDTVRGIDTSIAPPNALFILFSRALIETGAYGEAASSLRVWPEKNRLFS